MSYSPLNNYSYKEKSSFISSLDILSTPCRSLLGGRSVDVLSQTLSPLMPTTRKVVLVASCLLLGAAMPTVIGSLALISIASLLIKLATFPWKWEAKIVGNQSIEAWKVIGALEQADSERNSDEVIRIFKAHPEIRPRDSIWKKFAIAVRSKIDSQAPWEETKENLRFFSGDNKVDWVHYVVEKRFTSELAKNCSLTGADIFLLVIEALRGDKEEVKKCYAKMFSTFLQIKEDDDFIAKVMKLGLANQMIKFISIASTEETLMRLSLFPKGNSDIELQLLADDHEGMERISVSVEKIARINSFGSECLDRLENLLKPSEPVLFSKQWDAMHRSVMCFKMAIKSRIDPEEEIYRSSLKTRLTCMDQFIKNLQKGSLSFSDSETLAYIINVEANLKSETQKLLEFTPLGEPAHSTPLENILHVMHQKKRANIIILIEQINNKILQFVNERIKDVYV